MRADRLLTIMLKLQANGKMTTTQLADELEVSRRTILRDIDALSVAGIPIYTDSGHGGGVALDENYRVKLTGLQEAEARSLFLGGNAAILDDIGLGQAAENSMLKLFANLPSLHRNAVEQMQQRIHIDSVGWWHSEQPLTHLDDLQTAVYNNHLLQFGYHYRDGRYSERTVQPYGLVAKASVWYLIAKRDDDFRTYRISRMANIRILDESFMREDDFNLADFWQARVETFFDTMSLYTFTLRIKESRRSFITVYRLGDHAILSEDEGWFTAQFQVETLELAMMFVFGLGRDVIVLEPQELNDKVLAQARRLIAAEDDA